MRAMAITIILIRVMDVSSGGKAKTASAGKAGILSARHATCQRSALPLRGSFSVGQNNVRSSKSRGSAPQMAAAPRHRFNEMMMSAILCRNTLAPNQRFAKQNRSQPQL